MPTASGISDGKMPYGGMGIMLMDAGNNNSHSGSGYYEGDRRFEWSVTWDYETGFTGDGWTVRWGEMFTGSTAGTVDNDIQYMGSTAAIILTQNGTKSSPCATYVEVSS